MTTVIIDYNSGNLRSAEKSFSLMAREIGTQTICVSADPEQIALADRIVLPGVGAFANCKHALLKIDGLIEAITQHINKGKPFLGICVGMQMMARVGHEHGTHDGFNWINGEVVRLSPCDPSLKIPHMGWNELEIEKHHPVLEGIKTNDHAYFVHSYHMRLDSTDKCFAHTNYGQKITAVIGRDNIIGTQFHPEKSQKTGLRLIANFLKWAP